MEFLKVVNLAITHARNAPEATTINASFVIRQTTELWSEDSVPVSKAILMMEPILLARSVISHVLNVMVLLKMTVLAVTRTTIDYIRIPPNRASVLIAFMMMESPLRVKPVTILVSTVLETLKTIAVIAIR